MTVEKALQGLQQTLRIKPGKPGGDEPNAGFFTVPEDLSTHELPVVHLTSTRSFKIAHVEHELAVDSRYEHLDERGRQDAVKRFVVWALLDRTTSHLRRFNRTYARKVLDLHCYFAVVDLNLEEAVEIGHATLYPATDAQVANFPDLGLRGRYDSVIRVPTRGTNYELMMQRARIEAERTLQALRLALRRQMQLSYDQLRFRLGETYAFDERISGWALAAGTPTVTPLTMSVWETVKDDPTLRMAAEPQHDVDKKAAIALRWLDAAHLASDRTTGILFRFFALEAMLGSSSDKLKAPDLAFMRTMLSHVMHYSFTNPLLIYILYDKVRSRAVHGEAEFTVSDDALSEFDCNILDCVEDYLIFCDRNAITRQAKLREALCSHADAPKVLAWLQEHGPGEWGDFSIPNSEQTQQSELELAPDFSAKPKDPNPM
jgi:hypothetical protein